MRCCLICLRLAWPHKPETEKTIEQGKAEKPTEIAPEKGPMAPIPQATQLGLALGVLWFIGTHHRHCQARHLSGVKGSAREPVTSDERAAMRTHRLGWRLSTGAFALLGIGLLFCFFAPAIGFGTGDGSASESVYFLGVAVGRVGRIAQPVGVAVVDRRLAETPRTISLVRFWQFGSRISSHGSLDLSVVLELSSSDSSYGNRQRTCQKLLRESCRRFGPVS